MDPDAGGFRCPGSRRSSLSLAFSGGAQTGIGLSKIRSPFCTSLKQKDLCRKSHFPAGPLPAPLPGPNNEASLCVLVSLLPTGVREWVSTWQCLH